MTNPTSTPMTEGRDTEQAARELLRQIEALYAFPLTVKVREERQLATITAALTTAQPAGEGEACKQCGLGPGHFVHGPFGQDWHDFVSSPTPTEPAGELREALEWYGEQARLARLIHSEGDAGGHALQEDGGKRARKALAAAPDGEAE